jgi:hypothetical protein
MSTLATSLLPDGNPRGAALPVRHPLDQWSGAAGQLQLSRTLHYDYDPASPGAFLATLPAAGDPLAGMTWMAFKDFSSGQTGGGVMEVVLNYAQEEQDPGEPLPELPPDVCEEDTSAMDTLIAQHPDFFVPVGDYGGKAPVEFWDDEVAAFVFRELDMSDPANLAAAQQLGGLATFILGSTVVRCREHFYTQGATPNTDVGKLKTPPGYTLPTGWMSLVVSARWLQQGSFWALETAYQLIAKVAPAWVYDTA